MVFWIRVKFNYDTKRDKKCTRSRMKVSVGVAQFWLEQPIAISIKFVIIGRSWVRIPLPTFFIFFFFNPILVLGHFSTCFEACMLSYLV